MNQDGRRHGRRIHHQSQQLGHGGESIRNRDGNVISPDLRTDRRPRERRRGRVEGGPGRQVSNAVSQAVAVGVGGGNLGGESRAGDDLVRGRRGENRRAVDVEDLDEGNCGTLRAGGILGDKRDLVNSSLVVGGRPGEGLSRRIEISSGRHVLDEIGQRIAIQIAGHNLETQFEPLLAQDRRRRDHDRRPVRLGHREIDDLAGAEIPVGDSERHAVNSEFTKIRGPREQSGAGIQGRPTGQS